jgi:hypothetical protein
MSLASCSSTPGDRRSRKRLRPCDCVASLRRLFPPCISFTTLAILNACAESNLQRTYLSYLAYATYQSPNHRACDLLVNINRDHRPAVLRQENDSPSRNRTWSVPREESSLKHRPELPPQALEAGHERHESAVRIHVALSMNACQPP